MNGKLAPGRNASVNRLIGEIVGVSKDVANL